MDGAGSLVIEARREAAGGREYTSHRMNTGHKFHVQYGRIEARIRVPKGNGLWPAFWMMGADFLTGRPWPYNGEIDIMEVLGRDTRTGYSTLHAPAYNGGGYGQISRWPCLHHNEAGASKDFLRCPSDSMIESYLDFPQCWNGRDLDSPDHKSHMAYPVNNGCPASHPVHVPKLRQVLRYPANGDPARFRLSSGAGFTMHGDFFNAWPEAEMERRVRDCIRPKIKCGVNGTP
jgi:hypothetical protein